MATPSVTTILNEVGARLANITINNEYNYTVKKVDRARLDPFKGYDLPAINYWCTSVTNERNAYNDDDRRLELYIEIHSLTRDDPFIDIANKLAADVVTVLNRTTTEPKVSDTPNYELDGTISDFIFNGYDYEIGQGQEPWCGCLVKFSILYQTNPYDMTNYAV